MPVDWITLILVQNLGKPRTTKGKSQYLILAERERLEQEQRNKINRARVAEYLQKGAGPFQ